MDPARAASLRTRLSRLAWLLDNSIPIPGTRFRIGLDPLLGLVPGAGDAAGMILSAYIVLEAARAGAPWRTLSRMVLNVAVEGLVGVVPLVGDIFDAAFKANQRNVALLDDWLDEPGAAAASGRALLTLITAGLLAALVAVAVLMLLVGWWIVSGI